MDKFILTMAELMILMANAESNIANKKTCICDAQSTCFTCMTVELLRKISRKTGIPTQFPELKKRETIRASAHEIQPHADQ